MRDWAESGLLPLIGDANAPPLIGPAAVASCANGALAALRLLHGGDSLPGIDGSHLLSERAAFLGLSRRGPVSANGSCRLLRAGGGWLAVNLSRSSDWEMLTAWLEADADIADWDDLAARLESRAAHELEARAHLLGLPAAAWPARAPNPASAWFSVCMRGRRRETVATRPPLVVDLSSLWAGPLCGHLLGAVGARVVKVEDPHRIDGARHGDKGFYDLLNAGKESVAIDFGSETGRRQLLALLECADVVIEASRPRALRQIGIDAEAQVERREGLTWLSITGYGRREPEAQWVAFGDDAAVAAGATVGDPPLFCGDALADPLAGLHAAVAALAFWQGGGGALIDVSLVNVARYCMQAAAPTVSGEVVDRVGHYVLRSAENEWPIAAPRRRSALGRAEELGADTRRVMQEFSIPC